MSVTIESNRISDNSESLPEGILHPEHPNLRSTYVLVVFESNRISDNSESLPEGILHPEHPNLRSTYVLVVSGDTGQIKFTPKLSDFLFVKFTLLSPGAGTTTRVGN